MTESRDEAPPSGEPGDEKRSREKRSRGTGRSRSGRSRGGGREEGAPPKGAAGGPEKGAGRRKRGEGRGRVDRPKRGTGGRGDRRPKSGAGRRATARGAALRDRTRPRGPRPVLAVFTKAPEPGRVKTRLLPVLRAREAADLHRALLLDTIEIADRSGAEVVVAFTPSTARRSFERLLGRRRTLLPQGPGDLGARMAHVTGRLLAERRRPVLVVGSDCPGLSPEILERARAALAGTDVVVGPATDGGYYLLGLAAPHPEIFTGIPWGSERVLQATLRRIDAARLGRVVLAEARDLDTPADLFEWYAGARAADLKARFPRTWTFLHSILPPRRFAALEEAVTGIGEH